MKIAESSLNRQKKLWEKEKLLVTSNFSFSHSVFKGLVLQTRKTQGLFGRGLKSQKWLTRKMFVYKIQVNPIHTILKYDDYYEFMDR